jgi:hypothetical protein
MTADVPPTLPPAISPYRCDLEDVRRRFVEEAPAEQQRRRGDLFSVLELHSRMVAGLARGEEVRMWINGGFLTHKDWRLPRDVDVVYLIPRDALPQAVRPGRYGLWTLTDVSGRIGNSNMMFESDVLRPGFGLVDAYVAPDSLASRLLWSDSWSKVRGPDGETIPGRSTGVVEVMLNAS